MPAEHAPHAHIPRVALLCDLVEENWPSMDLVAEMLLTALGTEPLSPVAVTRVCPPLTRRFSTVRDAATDGRVGFKVDRALNRFWDYPRLIRGGRSRFDVHHVIDHSYAHLVHSLPAERTVVTCHDLHTFQALLEPESAGRSAPFRLMTRYILSGMQRAARVVFDTAAVRDDALARGIVSPDRARVAALGVHPAYSDAADPTADVEADRLLSAGAGKAEASIDLLHVGGTFRRKRIDLLLRTFAKVRERLPHARLLRVGGAFTPEQVELVSELGLDRAILVLPFLDRRVLAAVYRRAAVVLLPSEEEGFGLPMLEALRCGTPIVASDLPVLREVGGAAAVYAPVGALDQWAETLIALLTERTADAEAWAKRRAGGIAHAREYSWTEYARQMVECYREVAA